jgi:hypothetical protein
MSVNLLMCDDDVYMMYDPSNLLSTRCRQPDVIKYGLPDVGNQMSFARCSKTKKKFSIRLRSLTYG